MAGVDGSQFSDEPVTPLARWRRGTASGVILTGIALGLRDALESEQERPAMVQPAPTGDPHIAPFDLHLDPDHPEATVAIVRPWLFR
ncbi:MAG: hypothetical protein H0W70_14535 [Actinobacteria bacterium]|nr:hypothetical protein [Actinomycetota bacterium]